MNLELRKVFEPTQIGRMKLKNRLVCPPMVRNYGTETGFITKQTLEHYQAIARGGVGLIIVEATCVEAPRGKGWDYGLVLDDDRFIPGFADLAKSIHRHEARVAVQIHHAGLFADVGITHVQPVGPSGGLIQGFNPCKELTAVEIKDIVSKFARAAERAKKAGLDGVEIHGGHMYLLSQFLSPATNKRKDAYGGNLENRARFLMEVLTAIKESAGKDFPVWPRLNGQEFGLENGFTLEEAKLVAVMLEKGGADALHVSGWGAGKFMGYGGGVMYDPPGNLFPLAEAIKKVVGIPVIAVGKINLELAGDILRQGKADLVALGRSLLADPDLPHKAEEGRLEDIRPCIWCRTCGDMYLRKRRGIRCVVNAALGREGEYELTRSQTRKRVLVVGGGPGGMEAARVAALRGHEVMLYEREPKLGGRMILAAMPPYKNPIQAFTDYLAAQLRKLGVTVKLETEVTPVLVNTIKPDVVILATGGIPFLPDIPGIDRANVVMADDVLKGTAGVGPRVVIVGGGMVGCEIADFLSDLGKKVTVLEMLPELAPNVGMRMRNRLLERLAEKGVKLETKARCTGIGEKDVLYLNEEGQILKAEADTIVLAAGSKSNRSLYSAVGNLVPETYLLGDSLEPRQILEAVTEGFKIGSII